MKKILQIILGAYAKFALSLHKPRIIGVTGSVGKSSAKEAIALVLSKQFKVGSSSGNLNSQIGLPLSVLGFSQPGGFKKNLSSLAEWLWIVISGFFRIFRFNFPEILVLEMGTDRPGDIAYLLGITGKLNVAVITDIGISHLEFFPSPEALAEEKLSILRGLGKNSTAVLNGDNSKVTVGKSRAARAITYGFSIADVQARDYKFNTAPKGLSVVINSNGRDFDFFLPNAIGKPAVYACLAAMAVGKALGLELSQTIKILQNYNQPSGRLKILDGISHTTIIDDTYNAAVSSTIAAIEALETIPATRKLAAIGHMAELGSESEAGHRQVAAKIMESSIDLVFLVGEKTKVILEELQNNKFPGKVYWYPDSVQAKAEVKQNLSAGDAILVKGSQSARMEKIVKEIMLEPEKAAKFLVRQSKQWLD